MNKLIAESSIILILIGSCFQTLLSQDLKLKAEESPLSTVFYLLSKTDKDSKEEEKACLAKSLARADRFDEIEGAAKMFEDGGYAEDDLISLINTLIQNEKLKEASDFASYLLKRFDNDEYRLEKIWQPLVELNRGTEAVAIAGRFDDSDKVDAYFEITKAYLKQKNFEKGLELIEAISPIVENSPYDKDKALLALFYAKLGQEEKSLKFAKESLKKVIWKTGIMEFDHAVIADDIFDAYLILGKYELAKEILEKRGETADAGSLIKIAESYLEKGNRKKANEFLSLSESLLNVKEYSASFDLGDLIEIYLRLGQIGKAEKIAKSLSGSDYMQQEKLLHIADFYIKKKNNSKASKVLNFALEQTKKIDTGEGESGLLWTSGKWRLAQYQSQIALRFIDMKLDKQALELISQLKKPYLRALILTEFVAVNKKRIPSAQLKSYLEEALSLLRQKKVDIFDSKKFDVYAITARNFAEIGMSDKSNEVFAETLSTLDKEMIESGSDSGLLFAMCNIGVEFEKSKIKANEKLKESLQNIIKNWEADEY